MLACCHSFHQPCFQLQWNITKKKKKKKTHCTLPHQHQELELGMRWSIHQLESQFFSGVCEDKQNTKWILFSSSVGQKQDSTANCGDISWTCPNQDWEKGAFDCHGVFRSQKFVELGFTVSLSWVKTQHFLTLLLHKNTSKWLNNLGLLLWSIDGKYMCLQPNYWS